MNTAAAVTPMEWLHSIGTFINNFYEVQKANTAALRHGKTGNNLKLQSVVKKVPSSTHKSIGQVQNLKYYYFY